MKGTVLVVKITTFSRIADHLRSQIKSSPVKISDCVNVTKWRLDSISDRSDFRDKGLT